MKWSPLSFQFPIEYQHMKCIILGQCWVITKGFVFIKLPFPVPVNTKTTGEIPHGSPSVAISSPTAITAALAAAKEEYIKDAPIDRNGVEYPRCKYPEIKMKIRLSIVK